MLIILLYYLSGKDSVKIIRFKKISEISVITNFGGWFNAVNDIFDVSCL